MSEGLKSVNPVLLKLYGHSEYEFLNLFFVFVAIQRDD